ncbi:MAG: hypothetical protein HC911_15235 [Chloroflexaceae bacterium]|nr:hypothetical protein [Chloroflexaceae bacterium]
MNRSSKRGWAMYLMPRVVSIIAVVLLAGCMQAMPTDPALREASGTFGVSRPLATPTLEVYEYALPAPLERMPPPVAEPPASVFAPPPAEPEVIISAPPLPSYTNEERWRLQQRERQPFVAMQSFFTSNSQLWWYDPLQQQHLALGTFRGAFTVQARFILQSQNAPALEVPYQINRSYGVTALSPAIIERMQAAGYSEWVEAYVLETPDIVAP